MKKKIFKIIFINFVLIFFFLSSFIIFPSVGLDIYRYIKKVNLPSKIYISRENKLRSELLNYKNLEWSKKHFQELSNIDFEYYDYIGWRRNTYIGQTINIDKNGYRKNSNKYVLDFENSNTWIFGGSVVWGTGSKDSQTIPAILEQKTNKKILNLGESGYTSHQSLNLLNKLFVKGYSPKKIFFFDGPNEIIHKCRIEHNYFSSGREELIRTRLKKKLNEKKLETQSLLDPTMKIIEKIKKKFLKNEKRNQTNLTKTKTFFDCDKNPKKVENIINAIILDWKTAKLIADTREIEFTPVLQPVIFYGNPSIEHLNKSLIGDNLKNQFDSVYPKLIEKLNSINFEYLNLINIFDDEEIYYIDFMHFSPNGNKKIANLISELYFE